MLAAKEATEYAGVCAILSSWAHPACAQARAEGVCLGQRAYVWRSIAQITQKPGPRAFPSP